MTKKYIFGNHYEAFWPTDLWTAGSGTGAPPAGVTFVTSPPHPLASIGQKYIKFDCNDATSHLLIDMCQGQQSESGESISGAFRWGNVIQWIGQFGTTLPSSAALIMNTSTLLANYGYRLFWNTDGTMSLYDHEHGDALLGTSAATIPTGSDLLMEFWEIRYDSTGTLMSNTQYVVRYAAVPSPGNPPSYTTLINVNGAQGSINLGQTSPGFGEVTQRGAGVVFYACKVKNSTQNADDPYGMIRIDRMDPDGIGHLDEFPGAAGGANVNESGTAVPNDANNDSVTLNNSTAHEFYTLTAGNTGASDTILRLRVSQRVFIGTSKGTMSWSIGISDGTTDRFFTQALNPGSYTSAYVTFSLNGGGGALAQTDLAGLQAGVLVSSTVLVSANISVQTTTVAYEKAGETGTAVIAKVSGVRRRGVVI